MDFKSTEQNIYSCVKCKNLSILVLKSLRASEELEVIKIHSKISTLLNLIILKFYQKNIMSNLQTKMMWKPSKIVSIPEDAR